MLQKYCFFNDGTIDFDDTKSVSDLIIHSFDCFGYFEPFDMDIVTIFQANHPASNNGWFTLDKSKSCAEEIINPHELFYAYYILDLSFFAEGGWGHHMIELGNHPILTAPIPIHLRFGYFDNTVVVSGKYNVNDILSLLKHYEYLPNEVGEVVIRRIATNELPERIDLADPILRISLSEFYQAKICGHTSIVGLE